MSTIRPTSSSSIRSIRGTVVGSCRPSNHASAGSAERQSQVTRACLRPVTGTSVVVPCYNDAATVPGCLESLLGQTSRPAEVIVVDDCSTDEARAVAARFDVTVLTAPRKLHAGGARAAGFHASSGEFVAFVDCDMVLEATWMEQALRLLEADASLAAVGGAVEPPDSLNLCAWADYFMSFSAYFAGLEESLRIFLPTGNMLVRRRALETVRFRESYADEDTDLSFQLVDQGYGLLFSPGL